MKDLIEIFWKTQNFLVKLYVLGILGLVGLAIYIGLLFLAGEIEVEKSPEVIPKKPQYECSYSKLTEEYYCPDPPEEWIDDFPARP